MRRPGRTASRVTAALAATAVGVALAIVAVASTSGSADEQTPVLPSPDRPGSTGGVLLGRPLAVPKPLSRAAAAVVAAAAQRTYVIHYRAHDALLRPRVRPAAGVVRPQPPPADPADHLAARARRPGARQREPLGEPGGGRRLRRDQPGGAGEEARPLLLGRPGRDRRPRADAADRPGGQETLLLAAKFPSLLAGAISFDAPTDLAARFKAFPEITFGKHLQHLAYLEIGGTPWNDRIVVNQATQSGRLYAEIEKANARAPVAEFVGLWEHRHEMRWNRRLSGALALFGLMPPYGKHVDGLVTARAVATAVQK